MSADRDVTLRVEREEARERLDACEAHALDIESGFCPACDTGECADCGALVFYAASVEDYRHLYVNTPSCFLINEEDR